MLAPIVQDQAYHQFADQRAICGIANAGDTRATAAFLLVAGAGLLFLWRERRARRSFATLEEMHPYWLLFGAVAATTFGSAYYHLAPDDGRLVWDRLPMSIGFMALLCAVIGERISAPAGRALLLPGIALGIASVLYWALAGDLRPYLLVQYGSIAAVLLAVLFLRSPYRDGGPLALAVALYALAKLAEAYDREVFAFAAGSMSGHTLKHLLAAAALYAILAGLRRRDSGSLRPLVDHPLRLADRALDGADAHVAADPDV